MVQNGGSIHLPIDTVFLDVCAGRSPDMMLAKAARGLWHVEPTFMVTRTSMSSLCEIQLCCMLRICK